MFGKQGFIRTVESLIAIILLLGFILYTFNGEKNFSNTPKTVEDTNRFISNEFLFNNQFRTCFINTIGEGFCEDKVTSNCRSLLNDFITKSVPAGYDYECEICDSSQSCTNLRAPKDLSLYPKSVFIFSGTNAKVVRMYLYEKK